jgi:flagellar basal-body rod protein FlgC
MGLYNIFNVAGSSMSAQSIRLNTVASNLANADVVSSSPTDIYRSRQPVFAAVLQAMGNEQASVPVRVAGVVESQAAARQEYSPDNPMANEQGYIFRSNVNTIEEMANMMSASRSYQDNVEVFNTSKQLLLKTLNLGR